MQIDHPILQFKNVSISYTPGKNAVNHVNADIKKNRITAIMGPSGCGKSTLLRAINRMHELYPDIRISGEILMDNRNILKMNPMEVRRMAGMVFQRPNPFPTMSIFDNVIAGYKLNGIRLKKKEKEEIVETCLTNVGLWNEVKDALFKKGTFLSGGQQQRLCIARALALKPEVFLMDEPTSALDVTVQAQILDLLREMQDRVGASIIMITHDLGVVAEVSDKVAVMYAGRKVEEGSVEQILFNPQHPYTKALKGCIPHLQRTPSSGRHRLHEIPGMVLGMAELGKDRCSFYERCPCGKPECMEHNPPAKAIDAGHEVACWLYS